MVPEQCHWSGARPACRWYQLHGRQPVKLCVRPCTASCSASGGPSVTELPTLSLRSPQCHWSGPHCHWSGPHCHRPGARAACRRYHARDCQPRTQGIWMGTCGASRERRPRGGRCSVTGQARERPVAGTTRAAASRERWPKRASGPLSDNWPVSLVRRESGLSPVPRARPPAAHAGYSDGRARCIRCVVLPKHCEQALLLDRDPSSEKPGRLHAKKNA